MNTILRCASICLALLALRPDAHAAALDAHPGYWLGDIKLPDGRVQKLGVELFTRADGTPWASAAWPEDGPVDIPVTKIVPESGDAFLLDLGPAKLKLTWVQDHFQAEWKRGKTQLQADLRQVAAYPASIRPQTPRAPFPYREETLAIRSKEGVMLGATLSVPAAAAHPNVVVLVAGSGAMSRHVDVAGHRLFDVLADHLARQGVAVLRYDKRGIARSSGDYYGHTLADLEDDLGAVVQALAARKQFARIGLVGHSEGSKVSAAVAARQPEAVGFVVSLAGVGMPGFDLLLAQDRIAAQDNGAGPDDVARLMSYVRKYYETVLATPDGAPRIAALKALLDGLPADEQALVAKYKMNEGTLSPGMAAQPFLPASLKADSRKAWAQVRCPVLVLGGSLDHQVPSPDNVAGIADALKAGGNARVAAAVLPSLNHVFQTAQTGKDDEYARIEETMAPAVMQRVADFARRQ
jgi:pimeloyl-ACP methyl ester carboxylesterase